MEVINTCFVCRNEYILDSGEITTRSSDPGIGSSEDNNAVNVRITSSDDSDSGKAFSGSTSCSHSERFSCLRTITSLAPVARVGISSYSTFQEVSTEFLSVLM